MINNNDLGCDKQAYFSYFNSKCCQISKYIREWFINTEIKIMSDRNAYFTGNIDDIYKQCLSSKLY
jgi:hypothetical protein